MKKYIVVWVNCKPFYSAITHEFMGVKNDYRLTSKWNGDPKNLYVCTYRGEENLREVATGSIFCSIFKSLEEAKKYFDSQIGNGNATKNSPVYIISCISLFSQFVAEAAARKITDDLNIIKYNSFLTLYSKILEKKIFI